MQCTQVTPRTKGVRIASADRVAQTSLNLGITKEAITTGATNKETKE